VQGNGNGKDRSERMLIVKSDDMIYKIAERVNKLACTKCGNVLSVEDYAIMSPIRCSACQTSQLVPGRLKNFLIIEVLGSGGMASVYRAYDQTLGRMVAIKVMRREMSEDPKFVENFVREARSAAQLNHRNIVSIYSVDQIHDQPFIVMELLDGGRLDEWITKDEPIPEARLLDVARDVAEGLQAASAIGLVHGDIKPANILFNRAGVAKVADFGIARFQAKKLAKGEIWGTPYYIAPEKVRGQKEDLRSDIYSFGGTLFHAFSRVPPYDGPTATDVILARMKFPPPNLADLRADLHPETIAMISRMLEQDPVRRYPTYASLLSDIESARLVARTAPTSGPARRTGTEHPPASGKFPWIFVWIGAALLLAAAAGVGLYVRHSKAAQVKGSGIPPRDRPEIPAPGTVLPPKSNPLLPLQPFSGAEQRAFIDMGVAIADGKIEQAESDLLAFARQLPRDHSGRLWIPVFHALSPWMDQNSEQVVLRLKKLDEASFELQADQSVHPGFIAQAIGRILLGKATELPGGEEWPTWVNDLASFFKAYRRAQSGDLDGARAVWMAYADRTVPADLIWPYSLQPIARKWVNQILDWQKQSRNRAALAKNPEQTLSVLAELERQIREVPVWLRPSLQQEIDQIRPMADRTRSAAEKETAQRRIQADMDRVDELRANAQPLIQRNDFTAAVALLQSATGFETEEGRKMLELTRESYQRLATLKPFLIESIRAAPYRRGGRELGGDLVAATSSGLVIALPKGVGQSEKSWAQISPSLFAQITEYYLSTVRLAESAQADLILAASLYAYYNGAFPRVRSYVQKAVKQKPELLPVVHQLMPGMASE